MGMFDTVWLKCPVCQLEIELQSKAGDCCLLDYTEDEVPAAIAADLLGEPVTCACGTRLVVLWVPSNPATVKLRLARE